MAHQVIWTKLVLLAFIDLAQLTLLLLMIMRTRIKGWSRVKQSILFNMSLSSIDRVISVLKRKYDLAQKTSHILPPRKFSTELLYGDS